MRSLTVTFASELCPINVCQTHDDLIELTDWVNLHTMDGFSVFGLDVETTGLDPWADDFRVTLVQISDGTDTYVVPTDVPGAGMMLAAALENPRVKVATHTQFDAVALSSLGIVLGPKVIDTYVLSRLLNPGNSHDHGLKPLTTHWLSAPELEQADKARFEFFKREAQAHAPKGTVRSSRKIESWGWQTLDVTAPEILEYAGLDAVAVRRLAPVLCQALVNVGIPVELIEQELWLASVASAMRVKGMRIDTERINGLLSVYQQEMDEAKAAITTITGLPSALSPKRVEWLQEHGVVFDPARVTSTGRPQLDKDSLPDLCAKYPDSDVGIVLECSRILSERKNAAANLENFLAHADSEGRVHPEIKTLGARTGRMSIVNPALQTLKKSDPVLRGCFVAEPGMTLISADFAQIEIRVAAALSGDTMLSLPILNG